MTDVAHSDRFMVIADVIECAIKQLYTSTDITSVCHTPKGWSICVRWAAGESSYWYPPAASARKLINRWRVEYQTMARNASLLHEGLIDLDEFRAMNRKF